MRLYLPIRAARVHGAAARRHAASAVLAAAAVFLAACGSGGGDDSAVGGVVTTPQVLAQPNSTTAVVGQLAAFYVEAAGAELGYAWQEQRPGGAWEASNGSEVLQPDTFGSTLLIGPVDIARDETRLRSVARNTAGEAASNQARLDVIWGTTETLEPNTSSR